MTILVDGAWPQFWACRQTDKGIATASLKEAVENRWKHHREPVAREVPQPQIWHRTVECNLSLKSIFQADLLGEFYVKEERYLHCLSLDDGG